MNNSTLPYITNFNTAAILYTRGQKSALFDCGMAHKLLISEIKEHLGNRSLDYVFLTHSHYDHVGALPYVREEWPQCQVMGSAYARYVLTRPGALSTIRKYTLEAAKLDGATLPPYSDDNMKIDTILADGQMVDLGGTQVQAIALPGHTKCSLGYLIDDTILINSESTGYLNEENEVLPAFLVSGMDTLRSIRKCQNLKPEVFIPPHGLPILSSDWPDFWEQSWQSMRNTQAIILNHHQQGKTEAEILEILKKRNWTGSQQLEQPEFAFDANTKAMIHVTLAEAEEIAGLE